MTLENARVHGTHSALPSAVDDVPDTRTEPIALGPAPELSPVHLRVRLPRPRRPADVFTGPLRVSDASLAAAAPHNPTAFAAIYRRYGDSLHTFCLGMLRDPDAAADCVQDVFCTAAARLHQLREHDKLRPWLYAIARHEALARLRSRRREQPAEVLPERATDEDGPEVLAARGELAALVADAAGGLSDRDRAVLELHYRHGLDGPELADALGLSATNANTLVSRLRDTVERCLGALLVARHQPESVRRARRAPGCLGRRHDRPPPQAGQPPHRALPRVSGGQGSAGVPASAAGFGARGGARSRLAERRPRPGRTAPAPASGRRTRRDRGSGPGQLVAGRCVRRCALGHRPRPGASAPSIAIPAIVVAALMGAGVAGTSTVAAPSVVAPSTSSAGPPAPISPRPSSRPGATTEPAPTTTPPRAAPIEPGSGGRPGVVPANPGGSASPIPLGPMGPEKGMPAKPPPAASSSRNRIRQSSPEQPETTAPTEPTRPAPNGPDN